jgi:hypothetical protein
MSFRVSGFYKIIGEISRDILGSNISLIFIFMGPKSKSRSMEETRNIAVF